MPDLITRRSFARQFGFTVAAGGVAALLAPPLLQAATAGIDEAALSAADLESIALYSHTLCPMLAPADPHYRAVTATVAQASRQNPATAALIREGLNTINRPGKPGFVALTPDQRAEIVLSQQGTALFNYLHWLTAESVLRDPTLWKQIGYQGSAIEFGGYLNRGFDDIDWLPKAAQGAAS